MNRLVGLLLALALAAGGCAAGTTEGSRKELPKSDEKKQPGGYGNY